MWPTGTHHATIDFSTVPGLHYSIKKSQILFKSTAQQNLLTMTYNVHFNYCCIRLDSMHSEYKMLSSVQRYHEYQGI